MKIKKIGVKTVRDSRGEKTICVVVDGCGTSAPSGKSKGEFEVKPYKKNLKGDIREIKKLEKKLSEIEINEFKDLIKVEKIVFGKIGANSLFALEASILKALAKSSGKELWQLLNSKIKKMLIPVGNAIGGGVHSSGSRERPDFQEFLFISCDGKFKERVKKNERAYKIAGRLLKAHKRNDEGAWITELADENVFYIMRKIADKLKIEIGVDVAASSFFDKHYQYKNLKAKRNRREQIEYIISLIKKYKINYVEDPLDEKGFTEFSKLKKRAGCLIVGDDLTATNPVRLKKAISKKAINAVIVKPNQIGSLLKVKEVIDKAKKNHIKTIISHRSGETLDTTIADLGVGWGCDYIKTGIFGKERVAKLKRVVGIEGEI